MNREDIIRMAREAGATPYTNRHYPDRPTHTFNVEQLERFAALVAAAEQAKFSDDLIEYGKAMAATEREACAELCERMARRINSLDIRTAALEMAAENIRARGQV